MSFFHLSVAKIAPDSEKNLKFSPQMKKYAYI